MFTIIGADQRHYGPISADQLCRWIGEGRANAQTQAQAEGSPEWKPLAAFPEFAGALAARAVSTPPPPQSPPSLDSAEALAAQILARDYDVRIGDCVGRSWDMLQKNFWLLVGATFLVMLIAGAMGAVRILGPIVSMLLGGVLNGGLYYLYLKVKRGEPATVGDAFAGFSLAFVPLMLAGLISGLLTAVGLVCCLVPGIYLGVAWIFTLLLVVDRKLDFWPAMELSRKVVTRHWWVIFGLLLVNILIILGGVLACGIGIFVAVPITIGSLIFAYEDIFGQQTTQTD